MIVGVQLTAVRLPLYTIRRETGSLRGQGWPRPRLSQREQTQQALSDTRGKLGLPIFRYCFVVASVHAANHAQIKGPQPALPPVPTISDSELRLGTPARGNATMSSGETKVQLKFL